MMLRRKIYMFVLVGVVFGFAHGKSDTELQVRYDQIQDELAAAVTTDVQKKLLEAEKHKIMLALAGIDSTEESKVSVIPDVVRPVDLKAQKIIFEAKLNVVFARFTEQYLGSHELMLAAMMKDRYTYWLSRLDDESCPNHQLFIDLITVYIETARELFCKMQILTMSSAVVETLFGSLPLIQADSARVSNLFVKALHSITCTGGKMRHVTPGLIVDTLVDLLCREGLIQTSWKKPWLKSTIKRLFSVHFERPLAELMQRVLDLENEIENLLVLKKGKQDVFAKEFTKRSDMLMSELVQAGTLLNADGDETADWAQLFVSKLVLLKRTMLMRVQLAEEGQHAAVRQEVYVKHMVLVRDVLFNEMLMVPQLAGAAKNYESLVMRFLTGQMAPIASFQREQLMLLCQLKSLLTRIVPSCSGTKAVIHQSADSLVEATVARFVPIFSKRKSIEIYADLLREMIVIVEEIGKVVHNDGSVFGAASGVLTQLLGNKALMAALGPKELQLAATKLGMKSDELKLVLQSGSSNPKETVMRLLAHASPMLVSTILQYVRTGNVASNKPVASVSGVVLDAQIQQDPGLLAQIEEKAPGLMELLAGHVQAGL